MGLLILLVWAGAHVAGLLLAARICRRRRLMGPRRTALALLGALALPFAMMGVLAFLVGLATFEGVCHGFTDGEWTCGAGEYLSIQMFYAALFSVAPGAVYLLLTAALVGGALAGWWLRPLPAPEDALKAF